MYEISLVPDIKYKMLKKQHMRTLVVIICVFVAGGCVALLACLGIFYGGQAVFVAANDKEIACRSVGDTNCKTSTYGTPILKTENLSEILTIQDQMSNIGTLNNNKIKYSRVFGVLDLLLPDSSRDGNGNDVKISELATTFESESVSLSFEANATATGNTGYRALEAFIKNSAKLYYDYGNYMRYDNEAQEYVAIPTFCIEKEVMENGYVYGVYTKYAPGCEAPMVEKTENKDENVVEDEGDENSSESEATSLEDLVASAFDEESEQNEDTSKKKEVELIKIRRTYKDKNDLEKYKAGNEKTDDKSQDADKKLKGYYFESACLKYDDTTGKFDEAATLAECPLLTEPLTVGDNSYGIGEDGTRALRFSASVPVDINVFKAGNHHVSIYGPSRQNVTDSYVQIPNMFAKRAEDIDEGTK